MPVRITHRLPGRMRIEIDAMLRRPILAYKVETSLQSLAGVLDVSCNPQTGRALVQFNGRLITEERIVREIERALHAGTAAVLGGVSAKATVAVTTETQSQPSGSDVPHFAKTGHGASATGAGKQSPSGTPPFETDGDVPVNSSRSTVSSTTAGDVPVNSSRSTISSATAGDVHVNQSRNTISSATAGDVPVNSSRNTISSATAGDVHVNSSRSTAPSATTGTLPANPYRVPALASVAALSLLAVKRLFVGRSWLAAAPLPFYIAAGASIIAGYPALRRQAEDALHKRHRNPDLLLGTVALGLAAMRENLVALSAVTLLNLAMYRRHEVLQHPEATAIDPELERHGRAMTRAGFWLTPLTLFITRSPLRALGVWLAANPRPAHLAHKYRWANAERQAFEQGLPLPQKGSLEALAHAKTLVLADGTSLTENGQGLRVHALTTNDDEKDRSDKMTALAAALLQELPSHPLHSALQDLAKQESRTPRTAFHVHMEDDCVTGTINGHDIILGTKAALKNRGLDLTAALLAERRMRRDGYKPYILAQDGELCALFGCQQELAPSWRQRIDAWEADGFTVRCLHQGEHIPCEIEMITPYDLSLELEQGRPVVIIGNHKLEHSNPHLVTLPQEAVAHWDTLYPLSVQIKDQLSRDIGLVKIWNKVGIGLALVAPLTAPFLNLMADLVGVTLLTRQEWTQRLRQREVFSHKSQSKSQNHFAHLAAQEAAATSAAYHAMDAHEVLHHLHAQPSGLHSEQVTALRQHYGWNELEAPQPPSSWSIFFGQFKEFSTLILLGATALSLLMGERFNALCMGGILIVNAAIGTYQEKRSASVLQALKNEEESRTIAIRDQAEQHVFCRELVPGDIVLLESGDQVPADLRVLEAWNLEVNESILTGESLPVAKKATVMDADTPMADRHNLLYMGTVVTRGRVKGLVVATGATTQIGALQSLLHEGGEAPTPLQQRVEQIGKRFVYGALIAGAVVSVAGFLRGMPPIEMLLNSVTLAASAIPEGLPLTITIALTAGVMRMAKQKAVVRKLASLESLGRVTVICSDKTGTLTRNEMTVKEVVTVSGHWHVTGEGYKPEGEFAPAPLSADAEQLLKIGLLCNNATLEQQDGQYLSVGDPTETALLTVAQKAGLQKGDWTRHREIPFDSATGKMSVVCRESVGDDDSKPCLLLTKGSPEAILRLCTSYLENGEVKPLTDTVREEIVTSNLKLAKQALRVLGFAYRELCADEDPQSAPEDGLIYVGLMGMIDPPKADVASSIEEARRLGIKPVMITGDHPVTAQAIGEQLGIYQTGDRIVTGDELERLSADQLAGLVSNVSVFARVSPEHKLRIVEAYQKNGEIVAMTGDGVNDAPAVRRANVGIAMGAKGTDITKNTAGIVLMEDHFQAIVEGIKEGRTIIGNIRKAIGCLLTGNLAEVLVTATAVVAGLPVPLIPLQILLMNLLTDALPAMVLATDSRRTDEAKAHKDVVDKALYRQVITRGIVLGAGALGVFALGLMSGLSLPVAQTMTFATLVAGQLIQTVSWRQMGKAEKVSLREDRSLFAAMGVSWTALAAVIYLPALQGIFATAPLGLWHWLAVIGVAGSVTTLASTILRGNKQATDEEATPPTPSPLFAAA